MSLEILRRSCNIMALDINENSTKNKEDFVASYIFYLITVANHISVRSRVIAESRDYIENYLLGPTLMLGVNLYTEDPLYQISAEIAEELIDSVHFSLTDDYILSLPLPSLKTPFLWENHTLMFSVSSDIATTDTPFEQATVGLIEMFSRKGIFYAPTRPVNRFQHLSGSIQIPGF